MSQIVTQITCRVHRPWVYLWALLNLGFNLDVKWIFNRAVTVETVTE